MHTGTIKIMFSPIQYTIGTKGRNPIQHAHNANSNKGTYYCNVKQPSPLLKYTKLGHIRKSGFLPHRWGQPIGRPLINNRHNLHSKHKHVNQATRQSKN